MHRESCRPDFRVACAPGVWRQARLPAETRSTPAFAIARVSRAVAVARLPLSGSSRVGRVGKTTTPSRMEQSVEWPVALLQLVQTSTELKVGGEFRFERVGVCCLSRPRLTRRLAGGRRSRRRSGLSAVDELAHAGISSMVGSRSFCYERAVRPSRRSTPSSVSIRCGNDRSRRSSHAVGRNETTPQPAPAPWLRTGCWTTQASRAAAPHLARAAA
jgi:hypothetical protein